MTFFLDGHRHVHFVGIGGIGMSALAKILLARGMTVSGSDQAEGAQTEALRALGARVAPGHGASAIEGADLVVITPAAGGAPDVRAARAAGIPVIRRAELLGAVMNPGRGVAVAGTHGKSTTSALIAHLAVEAGLDPTVVIGAVSTNLGSNARTGNGPLVVVEADEFDAAFLELFPAIGLILSAEPEHLDYFGTPAAMFAAFARFASQVGETLLIGADDVPVEEISAGARCEVLTYGIHAGEWRAGEIEERGGSTCFSADLGDGPARYTMCLAGEHNVRNALAALLAARRLGIASDVAARALASFAGTGRRFQRIGEVDGVLVMDDYGHHPTEIRATLAAMQRRFDRRILLIFQPHTYSRTRAFLFDFVEAFAAADRVYLLDIYGARESDTLGVSSRDLVRAAAGRHQAVEYTGTSEETVRRVLHEAQPSDLVVTMGAGDVDRLGPVILSGLRDRAVSTP